MKSEHKHKQNTEPENCKFSKMFSYAYYVNGVTHMKKKKTTAYHTIIWFITKEIHRYDIVLLFYFHPTSLAFCWCARVVGHQFDYSMMMLGQMRSKTTD